ncbi:MULTISPECIES: hypothetical protein [Pyrobaculum]|uniref:hypothetical protein n=3 Tax=Thermoproteaceae TaxID=2267 RepID=UPI002FD8A442
MHYKTKLLLAVILITAVAAITYAQERGPGLPLASQFDVIRINAVVIDPDSYVFVEVRGLRHMPLYWNGTHFIPAPVVYFVRIENVTWIEVWSRGKPVEIAGQLAEGPYLAVPISALNKPKPPRGVPVDTPRGRAWLYFAEHPAAEGLPPYGVVLYLNATGDLPGHYRGKPIAKTAIALASGATMAPLPSGYADYLFVFQTNPVTVGSWWAAVPVKNATGLTTAGYTTSSAYRWYLGYRVAYIYLAVAASGTYSAKVDIYCADSPTPTSYCGTLTPLFSYAADLGLVFVFDNWNYMTKYIWATAYLQSSTVQTIKAFVSAAYRRPAPSDPSWSHLVFEWRNIFADSYSTTLPSGTRRVMFTAQIPQGSSTPTLVIPNLQIINCAGRNTQTVRIYVGRYLVYQASATASGAGPCYQFTYSTSVQASSALDYPRFNTSFVPIIMEFDPALVGYINTEPALTLTGYLQGNRWPQIWRESAFNYVRDMIVFGMVRTPYLMGNYYSFNLWSARDLKINETSYGLIAKYLVETTPVVEAVSVSGGRPYKTSVQYIGFSYGSIRPVWTYICFAVARTAGDKLLVAGPGTTTDWSLWGTVVEGSYWWANTITTFLSLFKNMPSWLGVILWGAGEVISKLFPSYSQCSIGSLTGLSYSGGLTSSIIAAYYNATFPVISGTPLTSINTDIAVNVAAARDPNDFRDYGVYTLYGKYKAPYIDVFLMSQWFDGPFEPYVLDGGILVRVYPR